ncbi:MAG TPA: hypothetical protein PKL57_06025 [Candidatus Wallbacteria bacterium]|nr:hypothetical protein [Candidatus Wallbacteria bacterium]
MNFYEKEYVISHIQATFIIITFILTVSFYSSGCIEKSDPYAPSPVRSNAAVEDNSGIASAVREHFGQSLGQIIAVENFQQSTAQAIVTVTMPKPDKARVYLVRANDKWVIERVQNSIDETDLPGIGE